MQFYTSADGFCFFGSIPEDPEDEDVENEELNTQEDSQKEGVLNPQWKKLQQP